MDFSIYAQRLLNPFRGVMNIIECQGAEAVTTDGRHWDIYVRDTGLVEGIANSHKVQTSDIRYGSWSLKEGLKRGAIYPCDDFRVLEHRGALVYEYLLNHHNDVPFPLEDRIALWLLDEENLPLGLLDSCGEGLPGINLETGLQGRRLPDTTYSPTLRTTRHYTRPECRQTVSPVSGYSG
jgi:hypothetical protein